VIWIHVGVQDRHRRPGLEKNGKWKIPQILVNGLSAVRIFPILLRKAGFTGDLSKYYVYTFRIENVVPARTTDTEPGDMG
jgi:hypothetical protein